MRFVRKGAGQKAERIIKWPNISAEKKLNVSRDDAMYLLDHIPAADVAPVAHGFWLRDGDKGGDCNAND